MKDKACSYLIAFTSPLPGKEVEYNNWYNNIHLKEVSALPGIISGRRFCMSKAQMGEPLHSHRYMVMYEVESGREAEVLEGIRTAMPNMNIEPVVDLSDSPSFMVEAIGDAVVSG
ncbi:DUF4286 family protein [Zhongshania marina]|uniref:Uncharacterized protein n=1 Tax=Zhongshania marina TaxID=2304603 RepID=A0ABX9W5U0_9GAMM|nr:hypothetical protein D0911_04340 [Zhongshania marina]